MSNNEKLSANIEEYLETIYKISQNEKIVKTSRISKDLGITSASVSEMLKKLDKMDYVNYSQYKGVKLTENSLCFLVILLATFRPFSVNFTPLYWE